MMRSSVWILGDQLLEEHPGLRLALQDGNRADLRVLLVESRRRTARLPYQRKKLVLLFSAMRHYARLLQERGFAVEIVQAADMLTGLIQHVETWQPGRMVTMAASQHGGRIFQSQLAQRLGVQLTLLPNTQFLAGQYDPFPQAAPGKRIIMENFYRRMRRYLGLLVDSQGEPLGGQWNYDKENRRPLPKDFTALSRMAFQPDEITRQVMAEVASLGNGAGSVEGFDLAVTHAQARQALDDFLEHRLERFGPYEDAMSSRSALLYHSYLSPYLNLGLLEPEQVARAAEQRYLAGRAPLASVEGFIRQVIGWREYICWQYNRQMPGLKEANFWNSQRPLPAFFWDGETEMNCLRTVLGRALQDGYAHHIERLMVLSNFCLLAGVAPMQANDWFTACFVDAFEWVMLPNVLGMGLFADGGVTATKPYIASGSYINKMSDYCTGCGYNPRLRYGEHACPYNFLYWNFLIEHEQVLRSNPRMGPNVLSLRHISPNERQLIQGQASGFLASLV